LHTLARSSHCGWVSILAEGVAALLRPVSRCACDAPPPSCSAYGFAHLAHRRAQALPNVNMIGISGWPGRGSRLATRLAVAASGFAYGARPSAFGRVCATPPLYLLPPCPARGPGVPVPPAPFGVSVAFFADCEWRSPGMAAPRGRPAGRRFLPLRARSPVDLYGRVPGLVLASTPHPALSCLGVLSLGSVFASSLPLLCPVFLPWPPGFFAGLGFSAAAPPLCRASLARSLCPPDPSPCVQPAFVSRSAREPHGPLAFPEKRIPADTILLPLRAAVFGFLRSGLWASRPRAAMGSQRRAAPRHNGWQLPGCGKPAAELLWTVRAAACKWWRGAALCTQLPVACSRVSGGSLGLFCLGGPPPARYPLSEAVACFRAYADCGSPRAGPTFRFCRHVFPPPRALVLWPVLILAGF